MQAHSGNGTGRGKNTKKNHGGHRTNGNGVAQNGAETPMYNGVAMAPSAMEVDMNAYVPRADYDMHMKTLTAQLEGVQSSMHQEINAVNQELQNANTTLQEANKVHDAEMLAKEALLKEKESENALLVEREKQHNAALAAAKVREEELEGEVKKAATAKTEAPLKVQVTEKVEAAVGCAVQAARTFPPSAYVITKAEDVTTAVTTQEDLSQCYHAATKTTTSKDLTLAAKFLTLLVLYATMNFSLAAKALSFAFPLEVRKSAQQEN